MARRCSGGWSTELASGDPPLFTAGVPSRGAGAYRRLLTDDGAHVPIGDDQFGAQGRRWLGSIPRMFGLMARSTVERRLPRPPFKMPDRTESMARLRDLLEDGALTPVVARTFPLEQVPDAIEFLASGQAVGRIVVVP
jgi:NADPH:quinone reductase-like Zn-dependent oxidoreductase